MYSSYPRQAGKSTLHEQWLNALNESAEYIKVVDVQAICDVYRKTKLQNQIAAEATNFFKKQYKEKLEWELLPIPSEKKEDIKNLVEETRWDCKNGEKWSLLKSFSNSVKRQMLEKLEEYKKNPEFFGTSHPYMTNIDNKIKVLKYLLDEAS